MFSLQKVSYLFILVIISIICSCHLIGKEMPEWQEITMKEISNDILELQKNLNKAKADIETLNETIKGLEKQKGSLETQNEKNKDTINTLNNDIKELTDKRYELESKVTQA